LSDKILKMLIVVGVLICCAALLTFPAALSGNKDQELLGTALAFFGIGSLIVALSLYLQSRALQSQINADPNLLAALQGSKRKGTCDNCKSAVPVIQCTMHRVTLCATCLVQHYDSRGCVYVPAVRKNARSKAGAAGRA
jgi:1,4-dihydroxy-2-naphthoate octaprenyltransferase